MNLEIRVLMVFVTILFSTSIIPPSLFLHFSFPPFLTVMHVVSSLGRVVYLLSFFYLAPFF